MPAFGGIAFCIATQLLTVIAVKNRQSQSYLEVYGHLSEPSERPGELGQWSPEFFCSLPSSFFLRHLTLPPTRDFSCSSLSLSWAEGRIVSCVFSSFFLHVFIFFAVRLSDGALAPVSPVSSVLFFGELVLPSFSSPPSVPPC